LKNGVVPTRNSCAFVLALVLAVVLVLVLASVFLLVPHGAHLTVVEESDGYFGVAHGGGVLGQYSYMTAISWVNKGQFYT
jgi:hypothetical protein